MKFRIAKGIVWGIVLGTVAGIIFFPKSKPQSQVLAEKIEITPTSTPQPTLTPTPTATPTPFARRSPERSRKDEGGKPVQRFTSEEIYSFTNTYGGQYGVDPNVLRHVALCESGFNPLAKNHIYAGLFQFDTRTWITFRQRIEQDPDPDLRYNAQAAVQTAAFMLSKNYGHLWPNCYPRSS